MPIQNSHHDQHQNHAQYQHQSPHQNQHHDQQQYQNQYRRRPFLAARPRRWFMMIMMLIMMIFNDFGRCVTIFNDVVDVQRVTTTLTYLADSKLF